MKELEIIIRPEKLEKLKSILDEFHCGGMTISSVMGCGTQRGNTEGETKVIKGLKTNINLLPKILVDVLVDKISREISTGSAGDGKIFIRSIEEVVRIRTGERGSEAI